MGAGGQTLPADVQLGRVTLQVADLAPSLSFYRDVIGFAVLHAYDENGHAVARLGAVEDRRVLLELHERRGARPVPPGGLLGLYHFAVLLPTRRDLGRFLLHLTRAGARFAAADHLFSEALYLTDPDGLQIEVYCDRPRSEWTYRDGEIVAATRPLSFDAVVAAADGEPWRGLPPGTTIGHVHLYVADLAAAREFYVEGLGFTPSVTTFPGALFVAAGGYHHHVGLNVWAADARAATADDARLLSWDLEFPDAEAVARIVAHLHRVGARTTPVVDDRPGTLIADPCNIQVRLTTVGR